MTDALALLALSQLVCLGGLGYLYLHVQELRRRLTRAEAILRRQAAANQEFARPVRAGSPARREELARLAAQMQQEGADLATLARRLQRSEEEVRLLLRRYGGVQP